MGLDKLLSKIQIQIRDLTSGLELFVDSSVQPSVEDCEKLQDQLCKLQECLAVYKYRKQEHDLSPSFTIHARVSEAAEEKNQAGKALTVQEEKKEEKTVTDKQPKSELKDEPIVFTSPVEDSKSASAQPLSIGINDKFRFINELFKQNNSEYNIAVEQLGTLRNWQDAELYLNSLKNLYEWKEDNEVVKYFYSIVRRRF